MGVIRQEPAPRGAAAGQANAYAEHHPAPPGAVSKLNVGRSCRLFEQRPRGGEGTGTPRVRRRGAWALPRRCKRRTANHPTIRAAMLMVVHVRAKAELAALNHKGSRFQRRPQLAHSAKILWPERAPPRERRHPPVPRDGCRQHYGGCPCRSSRTTIACPHRGRPGRRCGWFGDRPHQAPTVLKFRKHLTHNAGAASLVSFFNSDHKFMTRPRASVRTLRPEEDGDEASGRRWFFHGCHVNSGEQG